MDDAATVADERLELIFTCCHPAPGPRPAWQSSTGSTSTRAEFLSRLGRTDEARAAYRWALDLAQTDAERRFLADRLN
ncbi:tetratricopeptide repeat protein [Asanoa ferruginea]|uniref:Tetratricopeptide repeat protein n=1 Tax=Asanoa ferruginea TaxID=53367 RepID=A0A3D9ZE87_9ACTN|nr:tetratricopeptide repeat protein [Asanoa ferruginea]REF94782.1 tetratricopeptide repeat protein [Asanoa ferruginea]